MSEGFIGGFLSGFLARGFMGLRVGYGLYFTTARMFGVDPGSHGGSALASTTAGLIGDQLMPSLTAEQNATVIAELERVNDFVLGREVIRRIDLKKPGRWGIGLGKIVITLESGRAIRILLRHPIAYDRLDQLIRAFAPELVNW